MTLDELDANHVETPIHAPYGCMRHDAYWDHVCARGTKGCGVVHKETEVKRRYERAREAIATREEMALKGECYHCEGKMVELYSVVRMPGIKYFVCSDNKAHTVIIMPLELTK